MSKKGTLFEVWLANNRFRIAIDTYRDSNETKILGIWLPIGLRNLGRARIGYGRWSVDFWHYALKLEDYEN